MSNSFTNEYVGELREIRRALYRYFGPSIRRGLYIEFSELAREILPPPDDERGEQDRREPLD